MKSPGNDSDSSTKFCGSAISEKQLITIAIITITNPDVTLNSKWREMNFIRTAVRRFLTLALIYVLVLLETGLLASTRNTYLLKSGGAQERIKGITLIFRTQSNLEPSRTSTMELRKY